MQLILKNADIYLPQHFGVGDILIKDGKIKKIGKNISLKCKTLDCKNQIVTPMFVDGHEHLLGNHWDEEGIINSGVGTIVACLANEENFKCVEKLIEITKRVNKEYDIDAYCLAGSKNYVENSEQFILNNKNIVGIKTALFQPQRPKSNLSYEKLKDDAIKTYKAGLKSVKTTQVHIHLDHPFAKGEKVSVEEINFGKLDNLNWIDKIVEETSVPYSLFKLTHAQKYFDRILQYANKGCFIDYTAFNDKYDKRFDCLAEAIKNKKVDLSRVSISSDLGIMSMEKGESYETPITLLNTIQKLVLEKGLNLEDVLPLITTNALAPIKKVENLIEENAKAKLVILDKKFQIDKIILNNKILENNKEHKIQK